MTKPGPDLWPLLDYYATLSSDKNKRERERITEIASKQGSLREKGESACVRAHWQRESHRRKRETSGRLKERLCSQGKEIMGRDCRSYKEIGKFTGGLAAHCNSQTAHCNSQSPATVKALLSQNNKRITKPCSPNDMSSPVDLSLPPPTLAPIHLRRSEVWERTAYIRQPDTFGNAPLHSFPLL